MPRFAVHGTSGSWVKHGLDVQEDQLKAGVLPGASGWGADPLPARFYPGDGSEVCEPVPAGDYRPYYSGVRDAILGLGANPVTPAQPVVSIAVRETVVRAAGTGQMLTLPLTDAEHAAFA